MNVELAKKVCKEHGVKGFRKLKLKRVLYVAGKQGVYLNKFIANNLLDSLVNKGLIVSDLSTMRQLAEKGLFDTVTIGGY